MTLSAFLQLRMCPYRVPNTQIRSDSATHTIHRHVLACAPKKWKRVVCGTNAQQLVFRRHHILGGGGGGVDQRAISGAIAHRGGEASQPRRYRVPGQPLLNRHQVGGCLPQPRWAVCATGAGAEGGRDIWWTVGTTRGGAGHLGLTHTETPRGRLWTACGQRRVDSKKSQTTPATTSTTSIRQLLGATDVQTAHHATSSKSTARSSRQRAATRRNMRREERVTVQGPVKKQQPDGMSHRGGGLCRHPTQPGAAVPLRASPPSPVRKHGLVHTTPKEMEVVAVPGSPLL